MGFFFCSVEVLNISFPAVKAVNQTASAAVDGSENSTINTHRLSKSSELYFYSNPLTFFKKNIFFLSKLEVILRWFLSRWLNFDLWLQPDEVVWCAVHLSPVNGSAALTVHQGLRLITVSVCPDAFVLLRSCDTEELFLLRSKSWHLDHDEKTKQTLLVQFRAECLTSFEEWSEGTWWRGQSTSICIYMYICVHIFT